MGAPAEQGPPAWPHLHWSSRRSCEGGARTYTGPPAPVAPTAEQESVTATLFSPYPPAGHTPASRAPNPHSRSFELLIFYLWEGA